MKTTKYPRTYHFPFSPGLQNDDRRVEEGWFEHIKGKPLVLTEKLDGQNCYLSKYGVYARSHAAPTEHPWDINLIQKGGMYDQIKNLLGEEEGIYGENLYAIHSIEYENLPSYFFMFAARDNEKFYSHEEFLEMSELLNIPTVPILEIKTFETEKELEERILYWMSKGSAFGSTIEGIVVKNIESFPIEEFNKNVIKYVRKGHVQTDQFWAKNWKKAKLNYEKY